MCFLFYSLEKHKYSVIIMYAVTTHKSYYLFKNIYISKSKSILIKVTIIVAVGSGHSWASLDCNGMTTLPSTSPGSRSSHPFKGHPTRRFALQN